MVDANDKPETPATTEPDKGPGPTAEELAERAAGKEVQAADGDATEADAAKAAELAAAAAAAAPSTPPPMPPTPGEVRMSRFNEAADHLDTDLRLVADGLEPSGVFTDADRELLESEDIPVAEAFEHAAAEARERADARAADAPDGPADDKAQADHPEAARATRLSAAAAADRDRRGAGLSIAQRVHAAIDGAGSTHGEGLVDLDGATAGDVAEVFRAAGAMGWRCTIRDSYAHLQK